MLATACTALQGGALTPESAPFRVWPSHGAARRRVSLREDALYSCVTADPHIGGIPAADAMADTILDPVSPAGTVIAFNALMVGMPAVYVDSVGTRRVEEQNGRFTWQTLGVRGCWKMCGMLGVSIGAS